MRKFTFLDACAYVLTGSNEYALTGVGMNSENESLPHARTLQIHSSLSDPSEIHYCTGPQQVSHTVETHAGTTQSAVYRDGIRESLESVYNTGHSTQIYKNTRVCEKNRPAGAKILGGATYPPTILGGTT